MPDPDRLLSTLRRALLAFRDTPGRRGLAWLKLKKAYSTLDCVVVGAEYGHGKRKDVLSGLFFVLTLIAYVRYTRAPDWTEINAEA